MTIFESPLPALDPNVVENVTITQFVTKKIAEYGERDSLIDAFTGKVIKFNEILPTIKRVGAGFQKHGVKYDDVVFLCLPNCIEYAIIFHALGSIGATMTTTNPQYTQHELEHQFKDSTAKFIVTTPPLFHKLSELAKNQNIPVFAIHGDIEGAVSYETLLQSNEADIVEPSFDTKDKVLVIPYSSGTTGLPKGVCLTHYNIVCNVEQVIKIEHEVTPTDVFIGFLPLFHIYAMVVILNLSIALGVKTILMERFDLPKYLEIIQTHKVTYSHLVPPIAVLLAKHQIVPNYDLSSLKVIFSGAAPLSESLQNNVTQRLGNSIVVKQAFGMTETSPAISISPTSKSKHGSCGVLVPSLQAKIISTENGAVLGVGETGEIIVRGPNIMKCYFNLPEATAGIMDSEGFLHTGDVGHFDEEGYLYITDRVKELIKFKGFQVAPAELEAVLLTIHDIADAAVIGKPDEEAGELPRAYIVRKPGSTITEEEINKVVDAEVAHYKRLKGGIIFVDAIPKSPTGKILRRVLKARMIEEEAEKAIQFY